MKVKSVFYERLNHPSHILIDYKHFQRVEVKQACGVFDKRVWTEAHFLQLCEQLDTLIASGISLKTDQKTSVIHLQGVEPDLVVKQYHVINALHPWKYRVKTTRALRFWQYGQLLAEAGVSVIPVLGMWQHISWQGPLQSFVLMPFQPGFTLKAFISAHANELARIKTVVTEVITIYLRLQALNLSHGDFKASNFLVDNQDKVYLLDLDAVSYHHSAMMAKRAQARDWQRLLKNFRDMPELIVLFESELLAQQATQTI